MKNKLLKMICPMCNVEFITNRRDKIWCDKSCAAKLRDVKDCIDTNYRRQEQIQSNRFIYDLESNKFFINWKED